MNSILSRIFFFMYVQNLEQTPLDEDVRFMCVFFGTYFVFLNLGMQSTGPKNLKKKFGP